MQMELRVMSTLPNMTKDARHFFTPDDVRAKHFREERCAKTVGLENVHDQRDAVLPGVVVSENRAVQGQRRVIAMPPRTSHGGFRIDRDVNSQPVSCHLDLKGPSASILFGGPPGPFAVPASSIRCRP